MTTNTTRILEEFANVLDDADAWDMLARQGWRLIGLDRGIETWERDTATATRVRHSDRWLGRRPRS